MAEEKRNDILQVENEIKELKEKLVDINTENVDYDNQIVKIKTEYQQKISSLTKKHEKAVNAIKKDTEKLNKELVELDEQTKNLSDSYRKRMEEVEEEIANFKLNKLNVFDKALTKEKNNYKLKTAELNEKIETLNAKKNLYIERYNVQIVELDSKYKELVNKEKENEELLIQQDKETVSTNEALIKELEEKKNEITKLHNEKIIEIENKNKEILESIKSKEDSIYKNLSNELSELNEQLTNLIKQRDLKEKELEEENNKLTTELENIIKLNQTEIATLTENNDKLREAVIERQKELKSFAEKNTNAYNLRKHQYEDVIKTLGDKEERLVSELQAKLNKKDDEFKEKFSNLINGYDKTYKEEAKRFAKETEALEYKLSVESADFEKLVELHDKRFADKKEESDKVIESLKQKNHELVVNTSEKLKEYSNNISNLKLDLIKLEENNKAELEKIDADNALNIQEVTKKLAEKEDNIRREIISVNTKIKVFEDNVAQLNKDFINFKQNINAAKVQENDKHNTLVNELNNRREDLEKQIKVVETEILSLQTDKVDEMKSFYKAEKEKAEALYKERIESIKKQHALDLEKQKEDFDVSCEKAKNDHDSKLVTLAEDTTKLKEQIEDQILELKNNYEDHKVVLEELAIKLAKEQEEQIAYYEAQRQNLHNQIEDAKATYIKEQEEFKNKTNEIESQHLENLEKMKAEQDEKIKKLVYLMETIPTEELAKVKVKLEIEKSNDPSFEIETEKEKINDEFNEFVLSHKAIIGEAEAVYADLQKTYELSKAQKEVALESLNAKVNAKKEEIKEYQSSFDKELADIRNSNYEESEKLSKQLAEQLVETKEAFKSKYDIIERKYNLEIDVLKQELENKRVDYNALILDVDSKKSVLETNYKNKCEEEVSKTKTVQDELERILDANREQRAEWSRLINLRNDQIADENKVLVEKYKEAIEQKRADYTKRLDDIKDEIKDIKTKIAENEAYKLDKQNELDIHKMEAKIEMDKIKAQTDEIITDITAKSKLIVQQTATLEAVHAQKVNSYKKRVAELMAQLDELERLKPTIIKKNLDDGSAELVRKTEEFKNKIELLEKTNKDILDKLDLRRNQTVEAIKLEIKELVDGKTSTLKSHEDDLDKIIRTYEALLRDEASKQLSLNEQLVAEKSRIASEEAKYKADSQEIENEWNNAVQTLAKEHDENQQTLIDEMNPKLKEVSIELLSSKDTNQEILSDIESLKEENDMFDKQIIEDKNNLVEEYINKLEDINTLFYKNKEEEKERLKDVDVLSENILDLFKKH